MTSLKTNITLLLCILISLQIYGQQNLLKRKVNIQFVNESVGEALDKLSKAANCDVYYSPSDLPANRKITASYEQAEVSTIIKEIWGDYRLILRATSDDISIKPEPKKKKSDRKGNLQGQLKDDNNKPISFAMVVVKGTGKGGITDEKGNFEIRGIPEGESIIAISSIGYHPKEKRITIRPNQTTSVNIELLIWVNALDEVVVKGQSKATLKATEPIQITVLEAKELNVQPIGAQDLIKRSSGVQIREQGGLGSRASVSLNGLTGRAVRMFYDGIPIEFLGNGIGLNTLPIGLIERIDIYKGVAPVEVATDALGGVINIIPKKISGDYLEASYQVGSFNTHRASLNVRREINPKLALGFNGFYNYSNNNYRLRNVKDISFEIIRNDFGRLDTVFTENVIDARRFHNTHQSFSAEVQAEIYDTKWADRFSAAVGYTDRFDEIQHGTRLARRPFGEAETFANQWVGLINYSKRFGDDWIITQKSSFSYTKTFIDDSTSNTYDWNGNLLPFVDPNGAEIGSPTNRRGKNIGTTHRSTVKYSFNEKHYLVASNFFGYNQISGEDPYVSQITVGNSTIDPNRMKSSLGSNIFGLQYEATWLKGDRLTSTVFYKHYHFNGETVDIAFSGVDNNSLPVVSVKKSYHGGGAAIKYNFNKRFFIRTSYERTIRIPSILEFFGNFANIAQNPRIRAERGNNGNFGINFKTNRSENFGFSVELNGFIRDQQDRIRLDAPSPTFAIHVNDQRVLSRGAELTTRVWPDKNVKFDLNFSYQRVTLSETRSNDESIIGFDLVNIPDLFFNTSLSYTIPDLFNQNDRINFFWNYFYVNRFSIAFVKDLNTANPENIVPVQHDHTIGLSYNDTGKGLTFSASLNNVFDRTLFDNFKAPKPSRNIMFKILYQLNNKNK